MVLAQVQSAAAPSLEKAEVKVAAHGSLVGRGLTETQYTPSSLSIRRTTVENPLLNATRRTSQQPGSHNCSVSLTVRSPFQGFLAEHSSRAVLVCSRISKH